MIVRRDRRGLVGACAVVCLALVGCATAAASPLPRLPAPLYRMVAVAARGRIYVLGGHDRFGATVSGVEVFDPVRGVARRAGRLALPTHGAAAAVLGGQILVFGGASGSVHDVVQRFFPGSGRARVIGRLPGVRADVTATVVGGRAILVGGFDGAGPQGTVWATANGRSFRTVARLPQPVRYPAVAALGNVVYVFGGLISGGEYSGRFSDAIQRVVLPSGRARIVGRLRTPLAHAMAAVVAGRIYLIGGSAPGGPSDAIRRFDPAGGRTVVVGRLRRPRTDAAVATVGGTVYLLGGISRGPVAAITPVRPR